LSHPSRRNEDHGLRTGKAWTRLGGPMLRYSTRRTCQSF
jgi:hypothetical protein